MEYLNIKNLKEPGYYWWLPMCDVKSPENEKCWTIINFHPLHSHREKSGIVCGPIVAPVCSPIDLNKHLK